MRFSTIIALSASQAGAALAQVQGPYAAGNSSLTPGQTITRTVTRTKVGIVTACPPQVAHCAVGSRTTAVVVETTAVCPIPAYNDRRIVCYGSYCAPDYHCPSCERYRVVCRGEVCQLELTKSPEYHRLVACTGSQCKYHQCQGGECNRKLVCYNGRCAYEACKGNECQRNLVCRNDRCRFQQCKDSGCNQKLLCHGKQCTPQPHCGAAGASCPAPAPFGIPVQPVGGPNVAGSKVALNANCPGGKYGPNGVCLGQNGAAAGPNGAAAGPNRAGPNGAAVAVCPSGKVGPNGVCLGQNGAAAGPNGAGANGACPGGKIGPDGVCVGAQPGSGVQYPGAQPTNAAGEDVVQVAGSTKATAAFNLLGAAAGLVFML